MKKEFHNKPESYNVHLPRNPDTGKIYNTCLGFLKKYKDGNNND